MSFQSSASTLSLKDIMENGFLISSSSNSFSPGSSCFLEMNSIPRTEAWNSASNIQNMSKDGSLAVKVAESSLNGVQASCDGVASFCKTPIQPYAFDLSNLSSANNSKANSTEDAFCETKSSTPCKDIVSKLSENTLLKSSEINDNAVFKKPPPPPMWEISGIQATLDNTLPLEASTEELGFLGSIKTDTPSLDMSHFAMPLSGSGVHVPIHQV